MKRIQTLYARGHLTSRQLLTAQRFASNPNRFCLAPTLFQVLHQVIIRDRALEELEREKGWPRRSAKILVSVLLHSLEECEGMLWADEDYALDMLRREREVDRAALEVAEISQARGVTLFQARLFRRLLNDMGRPVTREALLRAMYEDRREADWPEGRGLDVQISGLRAALPDGLRIVCVRSVGYQLEDTASEARLARWREEHGAGRTIQEIAEAAGWPEFKVAEALVMATQEKAKT
jgi:DNA-binding winged helix-turn-helix (wHTH) protein